MCSRTAPVLGGYTGGKFKTVTFCSNAPAGPPLTSRSSDRRHDPWLVEGAALGRTVMYVNNVLGVEWNSYPYPPKASWTAT